MAYISVKLPSDALDLLVRYKARLMQERGERISDGQAIASALKSGLGKEARGSWEAIRGFAGSIEMSESEAEKLTTRIREDRKRWRSL